MNDKQQDRHLQTPGEANRDKHINFLAEERNEKDPADEGISKKVENKNVKKNYRRKTKNWKQKQQDRHLQAPGEANRDKHINFLAEERGEEDPADEGKNGSKDNKSSDDEPNAVYTNSDAAQQQIER